MTKSIIYAQLIHASPVKTKLMHFIDFHWMTKSSAINGKHFVDWMKKFKLHQTILSVVDILNRQTLKGVCHFVYIFLFFSSGETYLVFFVTLVIRDGIVTQNKFLSTFVVPSLNLPKNNLIVETANCKQKRPNKQSQANSSTTGNFEM